MKIATIERQLDKVASQYDYYRREIKRLKLLKELEHAELRKMATEEGGHVISERWDVQWIVVPRKKVDLVLLRQAVDLTPYTTVEPVNRLYVTAVGP